MDKTLLTPQNIPDELGPWKEILLRMAGRIEDLEGQLQSILRSKYGAKTESISPDQLRLFGDLVEPKTVDEELTEAVESSGKPLKRSVRKPSKELPRRQFYYDPEDLVCTCGETKSLIGQEVTERLDYTPSSVWVNEHIRRKYACRKCQGEVAIGPKAPQVIEKGYADPGMLAYIATSKYADHLPLHRLESIFKRQSATISRSTMCNWTISAGER